MDLPELIQKANQFNYEKVPQEKNQRLNARNYVGMIRDKGQLIIRNNNQTAKYMDDIKEYLEQLARINIFLTPGSKPASEKEPDKAVKSLI